MLGPCQCKRTLVDNMSLFGLIKGLKLSSPFLRQHLLLATVLLVALWELISADADADASPRYYGYRGYGYGRRGSYGKYIKPYYAGRYARYSSHHNVKD